MRAVTTLLATSVLFCLTACKEEQVLYKDKEASATVQATPAAAPAKDPHAGMQMPNDDVHAGLTMNSAQPAPASVAPIAPQMGGGPSSAAIKPAPEPRPRLAADAKRTPRTIAGVAFDFPGDWSETQPSSSMRAAQFDIPASSPDARGGELVVFHFGAGQGGSASANVARWLGQMEIPAGTETPIYQQVRNGLTLTEVIAAGTIKPSSMGTGPSSPQPGSMLHGLIVEGGPEGALFIKITGDEATVKAAEPAIVSLLESAKPAQ